MLGTCERHFTVICGTPGLVPPISLHSALGIQLPIHCPLLLLFPASPDRCSAVVFETSFVVGVGSCDVCLSAWRGQSFKSALGFCTHSPSTDRKTRSPLFRLNVRVCRSWGRRVHSTLRSFQRGLTFQTSSPGVNLSSPGNLPHAAVPAELTSSPAHGPVYRACVTICIVHADLHSDLSEDCCGGNEPWALPVGNVLRNQGRKYRSWGRKPHTHPPSRA